MDECAASSGPSNELQAFVVMCQLILLAESTHNNISGTGRRNPWRCKRRVYFRNGTNGYTISVLRNKWPAAGFSRHRITLGVHRSQRQRIGLLTISNHMA